MELVGIVSRPELRYCQERFLKEVEEQGLLPIAVATTTSEEHASELSSYLKEVYVVEENEAKDQSWLAKSRNKLLEIARLKKAEELLFLDANVLPPRGVIEKLRAFNAPIVVGVYLGPVPLKGKILIGPLVALDSPLSINDVTGVEGLLVKRAALGCALIRKEGFNLNFDPRAKAPDFDFCEKAIEKGLKIIANCNAKATVMLKERDLDWPLAAIGFSFKTKV